MCFNRVFQVAAVLALASACSPTTPAGKIWSRFTDDWRALKFKLGGTNPQPQPTLSAEEIAARSNRELIAEVYRVVLLRAPSSVQEWNAYAEVLNQGGSLEGVLRAFTRSSSWRSLEAAQGQATAEALQFFSEELSELEKSREHPGRYSESDALPMQPPEYPQGTGAEEGPVASMEFGAPTPKTGTPRASQSVEEIQGLFRGAGFYTLKRVLTHAALETVRERSRKPEAFAAWYAPWAVRLSSKKIDFGLEPRGRADVEFHRRWAINAPENQRVWEVLNRLHRGMNRFRGP